MTYDELKQEKRDIELERLEIKAALAKNKERYIVHGENQSFPDRVSAEAKLAELSVELFHVDTELGEMKLTHADTKKDVFRQVTAKLLTDKGLEAIFLAIKEEYQIVCKAQGVPLELM